MANLYDKAGLVNIPVGYQEGFLYNIKPTDNTLAFRFNRDSAATRVNKEGLIEQVGYFGPELITNGNFATDSDWTLNAAWTISNGKATYDNSASQSCEQSLNFEVGKKYLVNFEISDFTTNYRFDVYTGVSFIQSAIITNQTSYSILFDGDGGVKLRFRGLATGTGFSLDNVSVKEVLGDKPRIDYTDSLTSPSFLLEPQSTNLVPYSQTITEFSQTNATLFDNQTISPNGTQDAGGATKLGVNANDRIRETISVSNSTVYNISAFVKNSTIAVGGVSTISFRVTSGTLFRKGYEWGASSLSFSSTQDSGTITNEILEDYGNGWYRIGFSFTTNGTSGSFEIDLDRQNGSDTTTLFIWGAQLEEQSFATSYIPTFGSTATRAQETCNGAGSSSTFNSTEGVLYAEIAALADDGTFRMISVSDGTNDNRVRINYTATNQQIQSRVVVGGAQQAEINKFGFTNITDFTKIALSYKQNEVKLYINGELIGTDTSATMPSADTFNVLNFDGGNGSNDFYGKVKGVYVFNEALTDDELQQLTT